MSRILPGISSGGRTISARPASNAWPGEDGARRRSPASTMPPLALIARIPGESVETPVRQHDRKGPGTRGGRQRGKETLGGVTRRCVADGKLETVVHDTGTTSVRNHVDMVGPNRPARLDPAHRYRRGDVEKAFQRGRRVGLRMPHNDIRHAAVHPNRAQERAQRVQRCGGNRDADDRPWSVHGPSHPHTPDMVASERNRSP